MSDKLRVQAEPLVEVEATPCPAEFKRFVDKLNELAKHDTAAEPLGCAFERTITRRDFGSRDAQKRKTEWNQRLVEKALSPLLRDISLELPELARTLLEENPKEYLNLFPVAGKQNNTPTNLTEFVRRCFSSDAWALRLRDIWNEPIDLLIGGDDGGVETVVEFRPLCFWQMESPARVLLQGGFLRDVMGWVMKLEL